MRNALLAAGIVIAIGVAVSTINGVVDPKDQFYSSGPLTAALASGCLLADDVVGSRSYLEFKQDLFSRRTPKTVVFGSNMARRGVNMSFPGFGPGALLHAMRFLAHTIPKGRALTIFVVTDVSWFDPHARLTAGHTSLASKAGYLFSPWTLKASLDLVRRSRTLAFTGWQKERVGQFCIVDRGSPYPAWRADGTLAHAPKSSGSFVPSGFAWKRLSELDTALAIAQANHWRVVGFSGIPPRAEIYERELSALFAKHGYRWRIRRMPT